KLLPGRAAVPGRSAPSDQRRFHGVPSSANGRKSGPAFNSRHPRSTATTRKGSGCPRSGTRPRSSAIPHPGRLAKHDRLEKRVNRPWDKVRAEDATLGPPARVTWLQRSGVPKASALPNKDSAMTVLSSPRRHLLLPWTVQEREDPVLEFERGEGVYFYDRQGRRYLDFLSQLFHCNLGHGNRRVVEAIQGQAAKACCISPQLLTPAPPALP